MYGDASDENSIKFENRLDLSNDLFTEKWLKYAVYNYSICYIKHCISQILKEIMLQIQITDTRFDNTMY